MTSQSNCAEIYLNKLLNVNVDQIDIIGVSVALIYSKDIFKRNGDLKLFLKNVYNLEFLPYVTKSRTLIVARVSKELNKLTEEDLHIIKNKIISFFDDSNKNTENNVKFSKKNNANTKMKKWLEGL
ncbi:hypothetical protein MOE47_09480 [Bacillus atrophaeus]|uniref:hypothetical protein n=1 Tax=Bacillus atrophaeus TaxID=1452 RepID=UPI0022818145|nr:hypothetical protein [Bacillus atrophaeus]MCY8914283.1 hypothetical protein [Bacillus atrophaeus]MCY9114639.1 hypothetical protein [Bacillus atrophaeus]MEC0924135.1 hypothetical protein [Bacillus atrophaeus]MEC0932746.1 hypothetical protein [Bacillus atrophaeus]